MLGHYTTEAEWLGNKDLNLDSTSQSRKCCRYTIPQQSVQNALASTAGVIIANHGQLVKRFFNFFASFFQRLEWIRDLCRKLFIFTQNVLATYRFSV